MDILSACFGRRFKKLSSSNDEKLNPTYKGPLHWTSLPHQPPTYPIDEKLPSSSSSSSPYLTRSEATCAILCALLNADKPGRPLHAAIQDIAAQAGGWSEWLAVSVLNALQNLLKEGTEVLRGAIKEAYEKARIAAENIGEFAHDHPLYMTTICVVIALGVLVILSPVIIHALGFTAAGVEAGKLREMFILLYFSSSFALVVLFLKWSLEFGSFESGSVKSSRSYP